MDDQLVEIEIGLHTLSIHVCGLWCKNVIGYDENYLFLTHSSSMKDCIIYKKRRKKC